MVMCWKNYVMHKLTVYNYLQTHHTNSPTLLPYAARVTYFFGQPKKRKCPLGNYFELQKDTVPRHDDEHVMMDMRLFGHKEIPTCGCMCLSVTCLDHGVY